MSENNNKGYNLSRIGNFTKHAVENFEENIINQKDYLEKVKNNNKDL